VHPRGEGTVDSSFACGSLCPSQGPVIDAGAWDASPLPTGTGALSGPRVGVKTGLAFRVGYGIMDLQRAAHVV
jgi:hypothetical protein